METTIKKSLLITVRDTISCSQGVRFAGSFFKNHKDILFTLFYVMPKAQFGQNLSDPWGEENNDVSVLPPEIEKVFALCGNVLRRKGFSASQIKQVARNKQVGTIQDIIKEGKKGLYDAIILGKKSTSFLENILYGNKGHEVLEKELSAPVWFCRDPDETRKNILLCIDGSPASERAADHVGYILQGEDHHSVTLFHVDRGQDVDQEKAFLEAAGVLKSHGLPDERIKTTAVKGLRVTKAILDEAEDGEFAAIAIGSIGRTAKTGVYDRVIGSKCKNIFNEIDKAALWIVP